MKSFFSIRTIVQVALTIGLCLYAASPQAALQGSLGNNSSGSLNFTVTKPPRADITNLSDLTLPSWIAGDGAVTMYEDICVYSTRPNGSYTIRATGSDAGGAFGLSNGSHVLPYTVQWNDGGAGGLSGSGHALIASIVSSGMMHASTDSTSCSGHNPGSTARLIIAISNAQMSSAPSGTYLGILTLMVTPN